MTVYYWVDPCELNAAEKQLNLLVYARGNQSQSCTSNLLAISVTLVWSIMEIRFKKWKDNR